MLRDAAHAHAEVVSSGYPWGRPVWCPRGHDTRSTFSYTTKNADKGTDRAKKGADNANKGKDNATKGTDNATKGTDNANKGTDNANKGTSCPSSLVPA